MVIAQSTHVLPLEFNRRYPVLVRGHGVWVEDASGKRYLDAMSGGSMAATCSNATPTTLKQVARELESKLEARPVA